MTDSLTLQNDLRINIYYNTHFYLSENSGFLAEVSAILQNPGIFQHLFFSDIIVVSLDCPE